MSGEITSQNRQAASGNPLTNNAGGSDVDSAALLYQTSGTLHGERVVPRPQMNALAATELLENLAESGALYMLRNRTNNVPQAANARGAKAVSGRSSTSELRDTTSASADDDTPDAIVKRISTLLDAFDSGSEMGGGHGGGGSNSGGGSTGGDGNQQQHAQHVFGIGGSTAIHSAAFMDRMNAIRDKALDMVAARPHIDQGKLIEKVIDDVRIALADLSSDFVQQLLALSSIRSHFDAEDIFGKALDALQQDYDRFDIGGNLNRAVGETFIAVNARYLANATMETDPAATREMQRRGLRESEGRLDEIIVRLESTHPGVSFRSIISNYMTASGHELGGSDGANIDKEYLHNLLREIAALKMLNSVYDQVLDLLDRSNLKESDAFNAMDLMRVTLSFVSQPKPSIDESIKKFNALIPLGKASLDERLLLSTNFDDMHCNLPDGVFPGITVRDQSDARSVQQKAIKTWRHQLASEEMALVNPAAAARSKQSLGSLFGAASVRAAATQAA